MKDEPEEIERQRREYERMRKMLWATMRKILWAMSPLAIVFFVLWIVAYFLGASGIGSGEIDETAAPNRIAESA